MEYPHLQALYEQYKDQGFVMLSIETSNRPALAKEFTTSVGATFPIVLDTDNVSRGKFEIPGTPTNIFIDREGRMMFRVIGYTPGREKVFAATIEQMLAKKDAGASLQH